MPTPNDGTTEECPRDLSSGQITHTTCPPENDCPLQWVTIQSERRTNSAPSGASMTRVSSPPLVAPVAAAKDEGTRRQNNIINEMDADDEMFVADATVLQASDIENKDNASASVAHAPRASTVSSDGCLSWEFSNLRLLTTSCTSFFRPGSKFKGTQHSDLHEYAVQVDLKYVDMRESFVCGYLKIQGLTEDNPTLTTYFEGEIIGEKYSFHTRHPEWGSNEKVDMQHWNRFPAWRPFAKQAKKADFRLVNSAQRENIFMRWKEQFLVPDHNVRMITGASYEGYYYICFNQVAGSISGIYFHSKSEKYQQLELTHVEDGGIGGAMEFR